MPLDLKVVDVTLVIDTAIYASGDVLSATAKIPNALFDKNSPAMWQSMLAIDEADLGPAFDVYLLRANQSFGAFNTPSAITAVGARDVVAVKSIVAGDWKDIGAARVAMFSSIGLPVTPETDSQGDIYIATVLTAGTPTFGSASLLKLRLGFTT
jgi:hypothetical protein